MGAALGLNHLLAFDFLLEVDFSKIESVRTDHIGRPVFATDATGTVVWTASYLPFGGVHAST